uniref:Uncharacterized protein n=1 Tax=Arundo donax TaxID=35708 RepID=A0A0A8ZKE9_ARUDO
MRQPALAFSAILVEIFFRRSRC